MLLRALQYGPMAPEIRAAPADRAWMDAFQDRHAYRCLPLAISNTFGWEVLSPCDLVIEWSGGMAKEDLTVAAADGYELIDHFAASNFSRGIVTMHAGYIFRTEPGWSLLATGPLNLPIDGLSPLTGVIETDWLPYPFTMNWQVMAPGRVELARGTPFCHVFPVRQDTLEEVRFEIADMDAEEGLHERHEAFAARRGALMAEQAEGRAKGEKPAAWGREYFRGQLADGLQAPRHTHKMRLAEPIDLRKPGTAAAPREKRGRVEMKPGKEAKVAAEPRDIPAGIVKSSLTAWWAGDPETLPLAAPASIPELLVVEDFLSAEQCATICAAFAASFDKLAANPVDSFWDEKMLWFDDVDPDAVHARALMQQARYVAAYRIAEHFDCAERLYSDSQQLVVWNEGRSMQVHVDNAHPDGSLHNTPHRDFASVVYLNDDYEGGEVYFPRVPCRLRPVTGMLIGFRGTDAMPHGVTEVRSGVRYTMPGWYSRDPSVAERSMFTIC